MRPPDLDAGLCRALSPEVLEKTFFFPAAASVRHSPSKAARAAWEAAKEVCIECPAFLLCRENCWGEEFGVVGGTDEHERYLYRRHLTAELARKSADERAQLAAYFHTRHAGGLGDSAGLMARSTGYSKPAVEALIAEHEAVLDAQRPALAVAAAPEARRQAPEFPAADPPRADGWVWYRSRAHAGHYVAHTEDRVFVRMKIKPAGAQTTKWFPAAEVSLRTSITPVIQVWIARPDKEGRADGAEAA
ncbi:MAG: WhiB family transcriptional regulator [Humibacter sp.]